MITPGSFDIETCKTIVGDDRCRILESSAREHAGKGLLPVSDEDNIFTKGSSYWDKAQLTMQYTVWIEAYIKRNERLVRMNEK